MDTQQPFTTTPISPATINDLAPVSARAFASREERILTLAVSLPMNPDPFADKYFLRSHEILEGEGLNPWVRAQVVIRKGPGVVAGIDEAIAVITRYSDLLDHGGTIRAVDEGEHFEAGATLMVIEGPIQDIVALETMYLGVLSAATTEVTDGVTEIDLEKVESNMRAVVSLTGGRPVIYMGARHWRYQEDAAISEAAFKGGASTCSTDIGAATVGGKGIGTIPHVLENIMAWAYGKDRAVVEATMAFDRQIDPSVPRIALIDYNNREIDDSLSCARELEGRLWGVRVDTCGENIAQGALADENDPRAKDLLPAGIVIPEDQKKFWYGNGVTVTGVYALRRALDEAGFSEVKIVLSSGFAEVAKVKAFVEAEKLLETRLFDSLGVGGVFSSRHAKMDITGVAPAANLPFEAISKAGRTHRDNPRMESLFNVEAS